ncbi:MAG: hypothetical protein ABSE64_01475 [Vulcanimicrobiaceae bacterium]|jgi:hypothetical protein
MRDWPNPVYRGTLEEACAAVPAYPYVERIGLEVESIEPPHDRIVLLPSYDVGLPPWSGDFARCSDAGFDRIFLVLRVAKGYPGAMTCGRYPDDFPTGRR